jgi:hypothetical protein
LLLLLLFVVVVVVVVIFSDGCSGSNETERQIVAFTAAIVEKRCPHSTILSYSLHLVGEIYFKNLPNARSESLPYPFTFILATKTSCLPKQKTHNNNVCTKKHTQHLNIGT